jgi:cell division protein FtsW (lipid II flippase)
MLLQAAATASSTATTTPRRVAYLPEEHVDFIFSVHAERIAILRLIVVVVLVVTLIYVIRRRRRQSRPIS